MRPKKLNNPKMIKLSNNTVDILKNMMWDKEVYDEVIMRLIEIYIKYDEGDLIDAEEMSKPRLP